MLRLVHWIWTMTKSHISNQPHSHVSLTLVFSIEECEMCLCNVNNESIQF